MKISVDTHGFIYYIENYGDGSPASADVAQAQFLASQSVQAVTEVITMLGWELTQYIEKVEITFSMVTLARSFELLYEVVVRVPHTTQTLVIHGSSPLATYQLPLTSESFPGPDFVQAMVYGIRMGFHRQIREHSANLALLDGTLAVPERP
jgi:hypothetical protein